MHVFFNVVPGLWLNVLSISVTSYFISFHFCGYFLTFSRQVFISVTSYFFHFCGYFLTFSRQVFISVTSYFVSFLWLFFDLLQAGLYFCYIIFCFISVVIFWPSPDRSLFLLHRIFFISVVIFLPSSGRSLFNPYVYPANVENMVSF